MTLHSYFQLIIVCLTSPRLYVWHFTHKFYKSYFSHRNPGFNTSQDYLGHFCPKTHTNTNAFEPYSVVFVHASLSTGKKPLLECCPVRLNSVATHSAPLYSLHGHAQVHTSIYPICQRSWVVRNTTISTHVPNKKIRSEFILLGVEIMHGLCRSILLTHRASMKIKG